MRTGPSFHPEGLDGREWEYHDGVMPKLDKRGRKFTHLGKIRGACPTCGKDHTIMRELSSVRAANLKRLKRHPYRDVCAQFMVEKLIAQKDDTLSATCDPDIEFLAQMRRYTDARDQVVVNHNLRSAISPAIADILDNPWFGKHLVSIGRAEYEKKHGKTPRFRGNHLGQKLFDDFFIPSIKDVFAKTNPHLSEEVIDETVRKFCDRLPPELHQFRNKWTTLGAYLYNQVSLPWGVSVDGENKVLAREANELMLSIDDAVETIEPALAWFEAFMDTPTKDRGRPSEGTTDDDEDDDGEYEDDADTAERLADDMLRKDPREMGDRFRKRGTPMPPVKDPELKDKIETIKKGEAQVRWNQMDIVKHSFTSQAPAWKVQRGKNRSQEEGVIPRRFERLASDQRIYTHKIRVPSVSVLIDASGSMDVNAEDIRRIVDMLPGSTIGSYAGWDHDPTLTRVGKLYVIAERGKMVNLTIDDHLQPSLHGNGVDYPALQWLAEQPGPRLWVSDGGVTVSRNYGAGNLPYKQCVALCELAGIERVHHTYDAIELIIKRKRESDWKQPRLPVYRRNWRVYR